jgi:hypothetical protein
MTRYRLGNLAQRRAAAQLAKQHRRELMPGRELANPVVRPVMRRQFVETHPRSQSQDVVEDAIDMPHDVGPFRVPMSRQIPDTTRINVVRPFKNKKSEPDGRAMRPPAGAWRNTDEDH